MRLENLLGSAVEVDLTALLSWAHAGWRSAVRMSLDGMETEERMEEGRLRWRQEGGEEGQERKGTGATKFNIKATQILTLLVS